MRANKQSALVMFACVFAATGTAAHAGGNLGTAQSALDPENFVAPTSTHSIRGGAGAAPMAEPQEEIQSTTTFVTMPGQEPHNNVAEKQHKVAKAPKAPKEAKQHVEEVKEAKAPAPASGNDKGIVSDVGDKFKSAGSGLASGTKAAGDKMKEGSKVVGEGITSGAKASGSFFMKGARAIGSGTKKMGSKVAQGAKAAGDTMKDGTHVMADHIPFTGSKGGKAGDGAEAPKAVAAKQDDLKPAGEADKAAPQAPADKTKVAAVDSKKEEKMKLKTEEVQDKGPGLVGKTFGSFNKLNVFHKKDSNLTAGKAPNGAIFTH
ncbi:MAG TPA: hypothetical protein V6C76_04240 [Drouetiella sp.]